MLKIPDTNTNKTNTKDETSLKPLVDRIVSNPVPFIISKTPDTVDIKPSSYLIISKINSTNSNKRKKDNLDTLDNNNMDRETNNYSESKSEKKRKLPSSLQEAIGLYVSAGNNDNKTNNKATKKIKKQTTNNTGIINDDDAYVELSDEFYSPIKGEQNDNNNEDDFDVEGEDLFKKTLTKMDQSFDKSVEKFIGAKIDLNTDNIKENNQQEIDDFPAKNNKDIDEGVQKIFGTIKDAATHINNDNEIKIKDPTSISISEEFDFEMEGLPLTKKSTKSKKSSNNNDKNNNNNKNINNTGITITDRINTSSSSDSDYKSAQESATKYENDETYYEDQDSESSDNTSNNNVIHNGSIFASHDSKSPTLSSDMNLSIDESEELHKKTLEYLEKKAEEEDEDEEDNDEEYEEAKGREEHEEKEEEEEEEEDDDEDDDDDEKEEEEKDDDDDDDGEDDDDEDDDEQKEKKKKKSKEKSKEKKDHPQQPKKLNESSSSPSVKSPQVISHKAVELSDVYRFCEDPNDKGSNPPRRIIKNWDNVFKKLKPMGLLNHGVTCYTNAAVQALLHIPAIEYYLLDVLKGVYKDTIKKDSVTQILAETSKRLWLDGYNNVNVNNIDHIDGNNISLNKKASKGYFNPKKLINRLEDINCMMSVWQQEDSHEYFMSLMSRLQEDSVPKGHKMVESIIYDIFGGMLKQKVLCKSCQAISTTEQLFYDLSLNLKKEKKNYSVSNLNQDTSAATSATDTNNNILTTTTGSDETATKSHNTRHFSSKVNNDAIDVTSDTMNNHNASSTNTNENSINSTNNGPVGYSNGNSTYGKNYSVEKAISDFFQPELIKNEKDNNGYVCEKCGKRTHALKTNTIMRAPETLVVHLKRFRFDGVQSSKMKQGIAYQSLLDLSSYMDKNETTSKTNEPVKYQLIGVVVHEGRSLSSGHYVAHCKQPDGSWATYDDEYINKITEKQVLAEPNAYYLIYTRLTPKSVKTKEEDEYANNENDEANHQKTLANNLKRKRDFDKKNNKKHYSNNKKKQKNKKNINKHKRRSY
ncbi:uncharacterized protein SCODWIG_02562 [Saccharomycodes ludwigii]|uniref:ubiquitinyl hydrolase 1 n=1 Tax=Saccharomycodes ludwigii TaxID=36035 RepID=A0A376B856_9ASCO|nr:uncharacterized protein SCODWIG_02562 [Saccharomycodes ludwigii]